MAGKLDFTTLTPEQKQHWLDSVTAAVAPFIADHASQFAEELLGFLAANLSVSRYDHIVFGEAMHPGQLAVEPQSVQTQACCQSDHDAGADMGRHDSTSASSHLSQGDVSDADSEAYLSLLQHQYRHYAPQDHSIQKDNVPPSCSLPQVFEREDKDTDEAAVSGPSTMDNYPGSASCSSRNAGSNSTLKARHKHKKHK